MAKGLGIIGNYTGKVGNTVGYFVRNSKNKQTQGIRIYQPVVRNPQSTLQMQQRIKITAVSNLYRQFKAVLRRSMENQEYGDASRRAWLKQALGSQFSAGPWLLKGSTQAFPIPGVNMSVGSLPDINYQLTPGDYYVGWEINRADTTADANVTTVGDLSKYLIFEGNVQEGDQVTILAGYASAAGVKWGPVRSFYVSTASSTPLENLGLAFSSFTEGEGSTQGDIYVNLLTEASLFANVVCLITGRDGADEQHLRNTAQFVLGRDAQALVVYNGQYKSTAIESYRKQASSTEDWQVTRSAGADDTITMRTRGGDSVVIVSLTQAGSYLQAVADDGAQYFIFGTNTRVNSYNKYINSLSTNTETAPSGATNANTIGTNYGSTTAEQDATAAEFANWFVRQGGSIGAVY